MMFVPVYVLSIFATPRTLSWVNPGLCHGFKNNNNIIIIIAATTLAAGAAADKAAAHKEMKYSALASTHIFFPVALETSSVMNRLAVDLVSEIGRRISSVTARRHQGDHVPVPTAFCSSPGGKCSLLSSHFCQLRNVIAVAVLHFAYQYFISLGI